MNKEESIKKKLAQPTLEIRGLYSIRIPNNISNIRLKIIANRCGYELVAKEEVGEKGKFLIVYVTDELHNYVRVKPTCDNWYFSRVARVVNDLIETNNHYIFLKYTITMYRNLANINEKIYIVRDFSNNIYVVKKTETWINDKDKLDYIIKWKFNDNKQILVRKGDYKS